MPPHTGAGGRLRPARPQSAPAGRRNMPQPSTAPAPEAPFVRRRSIPLRWWICGLLFLATTINYVDRQTVPLLAKEFLQRQFGWDEAGYGWIMFAFQLAYAVMFTVSGRLLDRFGVRVTMIWAVV